MKLLPYAALGGAFGFLLVEAEVVSWFRIRRCSGSKPSTCTGSSARRFVTAAMSLLVIKRLRLRSPDGQPLGPGAEDGRAPACRYLAGGSMFGLGWALDRSLPGPLVALVGAGVPVMVVTILSALAGTWTYGRLRPRLPH